MSIQPLILTAIVLSPMAAMADGHDHQKVHTTQLNFYKELYREEYVAGTRSSKGYVKSYLDKLEVPCSALSWHRPVLKYPQRNNQIHYLHRRHYRPIRQQVLVSKSYQTGGGSRNSDNTTTGGLIGGDLSASISKR